MNIEITTLTEEVKSLKEEIQSLKDQIASLQEQLNGFQETLYLLSIPGMREKILEGGKTPLEECSEDINW